MNKSADAYAIRDVLQRQIEYWISCEDERQSLALLCYYKTQ